MINLDRYYVIIAKGRSGMGDMHTTHGR